MKKPITIDQLPDGNFELVKQDTYGDFHKIPFELTSEHTKKNAHLLYRNVASGEVYQVPNFWYSVGLKNPGEQESPMHDRIHGLLQTLQQSDSLDDKSAAENFLYRIGGLFYDHTKQNYRNFIRQDDLPYLYSGNQVFGEYLVRLQNILDQHQEIPYLLAKKGDIEIPIKLTIYDVINDLKMTPNESELVIFIEDESRLINSVADNLLKEYQLYEGSQYSRGFTVNKVTNSARKAIHP